MAPQETPIAKQLSMQVIDVMLDKGISAVDQVAGKAFFATIENLISRWKKLAMTKSLGPLPYTEIVSSSIIKIINNVEEQNVASRINDGYDTQINITAHMITGCGLKSLARSQFR